MRRRDASCGLSRSVLWCVRRRQDSSRWLLRGTLRLYRRAQESGMVGVLLCVACVSVAILAAMAGALAHIRRRRGVGERPSGFRILVLVSSALMTLATVVVVGSVHLSMPSDAEVFERWVGLEITEDVELLWVEWDGFTDRMEVQACFRASAENIASLIESRQLVASSDSPPLHACVGASASRYQRSSGPGTGGEATQDVNGFASEVHVLAHQPGTGTAYY